MLPVILNETFWSFGTTAYSVVYARIGTDSIAAMNIVSTIDNLAFVFIFGLANATAIMVGNRIGAGEEAQAFQYAVRSLVLGMLFGVLVGSQVLLWSPYILGLYKVPPVVIEYASKVLVILAALVWLRAANSIIVVGILRSGGDATLLFLPGRDGHLGGGRADGVLHRFRPAPARLLGLPGNHVGGAAEVGHRHVPYLLQEMDPQPDPHGRRYRKTERSPWDI